MSEVYIDVVSLVQYYPRTVTSLSLMLDVFVTSLSLMLDVFVTSLSLMLDIFVISIIFAAERERLCPLLLSQQEN